MPDVLRQTYSCTTTFLLIAVFGHSAHIFLSHLNIPRHGKLMFGDGTVSESDAHTCTAALKYTSTKEESPGRRTWRWRRRNEKARLNPFVPAANRGNTGAGWVTDRTLPGCHPERSAEA